MKEKKTMLQMLRDLNVFFFFFWGGGIVVHAVVGSSLRDTCVCFDAYNDDRSLRRCTNAGTGFVGQLVGYNQVVQGTDLQSKICKSHKTLLLDRVHPSTENKASSSRGGRTIQHKPTDDVVIKQGPCFLCEGLLTSVSRCGTFQCPQHVFRVAGVLVALPCSTFKCKTVMERLGIHATAPFFETVYTVCNACCVKHDIHLITKTENRQPFVCACSEMDEVCLWI